MGSHRTFLPLEVEGGLLADLSSDPFPSRLAGWSEEPIDLPEGGTHFGFAWRAGGSLECAAGRLPLAQGMYFALPGPGRIVGGGAGIVITRVGEHALFHFGGPVEERGRLRYIDGCTDTLLVPPTIQGQACLNLLHIPAGTFQTQHTHPSHRIGMILKGSGRCVTPDAEVQLRPGMVFVIHAEGMHSFVTESEDLLVLAYHPDSDFGPTHEDHPMLNRTIVDGVSASPIHRRGLAEIDAGSAR